jgi:Flp pilus assembly protein TadG
VRILNPLRRLSCLLHQIARDRSAIAIVEFAVALPFLLVTMLSLTELTNFTIVRMRVGQLALQVADNASRMGRIPTGGTGNPQVTETDINDLFTGADLQAKNLAIYTHGRVILSSLEATANPNTAGTFTIRWQRCRGVKSSVSTWGVQGATALNGMGPTGQVVTTPDDTGVMYVEVFYDYQPLFASGLVPHTTIREKAAMIVRDSRDYTGNGGTGVYNTVGDPVHSCDQFTTT